MIMIKKLSLAVSLLLMPLMVQNIYAEAREPVAVKQRIQTVTFDVQNMTCAMCQFTIKKALKKVEGVQKVSVDTTQKTATVIFDSQKNNVEALIKATTDAGYPATIRTKHP